MIPRLQLAFLHSIYVLAIVELARVIWRLEFPINTPTVLQAVVIFLVDALMFALVGITLLNLSLREDARLGFARHALRVWLPRGGGFLVGLWLLSQLSVLWSAHIVLAQYDALHLLAGILLAAVISQQQNIKPLLWALVIGGAIQAAIALAQVLNGDVLGLDFLGEPQAAYFSSQGTMRAYGLSHNPNQLAVYLLLALFAALHLRRLGASQNGWLIGLLVLGLVATGSRTGMLAALVGGAVLMPRRAWLFLPMLAGILVVRQVLFPAEASLVDNLSQRLFFEFDDTLQIIQKNPLMGVGAHHLMFAIAEQNPPGALVLPAHNSFLIVWAELGIGGMLLLLGAYGQMLRYRPLQIWQAVLLAMGVILLFDFTLWSDLHMRTLWFIGWGMAWQQAQACCQSD